MFVFECFVLNINLYLYIYFTSSMVTYEVRGEWYIRKIAKDEFKICVGCALCIVFCKYNCKAIHTTKPEIKQKGELFLCGRVKCNPLYGDDDDQN